MSTVSVYLQQVSVRDATEMELKLEAYPSESARISPRSFLLCSFADRRRCLQGQALRDAQEVAGFRNALNILELFFAIPESACKGFFVKKQLTSSHLHIC